MEKNLKKKMMDLKVNLPLEEQLNLGWKIIKAHFSPEETALPSKLIKSYWYKENK